MIIVFMNRDYESNEDTEMVRLQQALDRWDVGRRVEEKKKAALLQKSPTSAYDLSAEAKRRNARL
jgi:hypothetical protein